MKIKSLVSLVSICLLVIVNSNEETELVVGYDGEDNYKLKRPAGMGLRVA